MSFFDTLQKMGLFQGGQQQPAQPQENPYGLDQQAMRQVGWQTLGNLGSQIMALSQQMTPAQRAAMMSRADFTGGLQENMYNAAQMKLLADRRKQTAQQDDRTKAAQAYVARTLQQMPDGPAKQKAMAYMQLGDLPKAVETLYSVTERKAPDLKTVRVGDKDVTYQWNDSTGQWQKFGEGVAFKPDAPAKPNYQFKDGYLINMDDPTAPAVKVPGLPDAPADEVSVKDKSDMANTILDDRRAEMAEPQKVVDFAQSIEDTLSSGNPTAMRALATQVLFAKVLDPGSAFMTGEAELQQAAASWSQRMTQFLSRANEGTPIPPELVLEMRDIARQLGKKALGKLETVDRTAKTRAGSLGITDDMLGGQFPLRWNRFADPAISESGTGRREPIDPVMDDLTRYGG